MNTTLTDMEHELHILDCERRWQWLGDLAAVTDNTCFFLGMGQLHAERDAAK